MTFTYDPEADLSQIIEFYVINNNVYTVYYLDGSKETYEAGEEENFRLQKIMVKQALERQMCTNVDYLKEAEAKNYFMATLFGSIGVLSFQNRHFFISALGVAGLVHNIKEAIIKRVHINELKKYQTFFEYEQLLIQLPPEEIMKIFRSSKYLQDLVINRLEEQKLSNLKLAKKYVKQKVINYKRNNQN